MTTRADRKEADTSRPTRASAGGARSEPKASEGGPPQSEAKPSEGRQPERERIASAKVRQKARRIEETLDRLYPDAAVPLAHEDPFTLLVAVVLSAQCTDARVNLVTPGLFARASTPAAMAKLKVAEIQRLIRSCGLAPTKAKHIAALSRALVAEHGGRVPRTLDLLEELPGVGHKTASVVLVQAFGEPAFPVDTHIHRLAGRWGLSRARNVAETERDLKSLFAPSHWGKVHLQMIYFGREHCPALRHDRATCPVCSWAAPKRRAAARRSLTKTRRERARRRSRRS